MPKTYTTVQGDTWDIISLKAYGSSSFTNYIFEANPKYKKVMIFGAGSVLTIPDITEAERNKSILPPWVKKS